MTLSGDVDLFLEYAKKKKKKKKKKKRNLVVVLESKDL